MTGYAGVVALMLVAVAMCGRRTPATWFFFGLAVFSLLIATGSPLYRLMFMLPGFKQVAAVARILVLFDFSVAVLTAMGMQVLLIVEPLPRFKRSGAVLGLLMLVPIVAAVGASDAWTQNWVKGQGMDDSYGAILLMPSVERSCVAAAILIAFAAALLAVRGFTERSWKLSCLLLPAVVIADLFLFGFNFNPSCPRSMLDVPPSLLELRDRVGDGRIITLAPQDSRGFVEVLPPNLNMLAGIRSAQGSDSLYPTWYAELLARSGLRALDRSKEINQFYYSMLLGVRYVLRPPERGSGRDFLLEAHKVLPRAFESESEELLMSTVGRFGRESERPRGRDWTLTSVLRDETNRVAVQGMAKFNRLNLIDTYFPGWHAFAGKEPLRIERAFHALRAVPARAGMTTFVYLPTAFRAGAFVTMLTLAALVGWFVAQSLSGRDARPTITHTPQ